MSFPNGLSEGSVNGLSALLDRDGTQTRYQAAPYVGTGLSGPKGQDEWHHGSVFRLISRKRYEAFLFPLLHVSAAHDWLASHNNMNIKQEEHTMKRIISLIIAAAIFFSLSAFALAETYTIGVGQFAQHGSLDNCYEGFLAGLAEAGIVEGENLKIDFQNAQADMGIAQQIAAQFASGRVDMMVGIATPMAQACYNAASNRIPTIFTAVTDPVAAGFAYADGTASGNVTGTSDALPIEAQLKTIRAMLPDAKKVGILYTTSEVNSISAIELYKQLAPAYGFEIVESGISTIADIPLALDALLSKVDCLTNLTDNTVVSALALMLDKANAARKPVFGSEIEQVKLGCIAAEGLDYIALGRQTGLMAAQVLKGEAKANEIPYEIITEPGLYVNSNVMKQFGITLSDELAERAIETN